MRIMVINWIRIIKMGGTFEFTGARLPEFLEQDRDWSDWF